MTVTVLLLQLCCTLALALPSPSTAIQAVAEVGDVDAETAVVVRDKRDPSRSFMFSGFMPGRGGGMSAFASNSDPYYPYRPRAHPHSQPQHPAAHYPEGEIPSTAEQPPELSWKGDEDKEEDGEEDHVTKPPKKHKKKHPPKEAAEDEEEYEKEKPSRGGGGGNAAASFNAWFPIMLGMFPPSGGYPGNDGGFSRGGGQGQGQGRNPSGQATVIANSENHGSHGVASSHAVYYGGAGPDSAHSGGNGGNHRQNIWR